MAGKVGAKGPGQARRDYQVATADAALHSVAVRSSARDGAGASNRLRFFCESRREISIASTRADFLLLREVQDPSEGTSQVPATSAPLEKFGARIRAPLRGRLVSDGAQR